MERFYKGQHINTKEELLDCVVPLDSYTFKRPRVLTLEKLGGILMVDINDDIVQRNVTSVVPENQEGDPTVAPNGLPIIEKTFISVDENYLYVWIPSLEKWKRVLLSDWD